MAEITFQLFWIIAAGLFVVMNISNYLSNRLPKAMPIVPLAGIIIGAAIAYIFHPAYGLLLLGWVDHRTQLSMICYS